MRRFMGCGRRQGRLDENASHAEAIALHATSSCRRARERPEAQQGKNDDGEIRRVRRRVQDCGLLHRATRLAHVARECVDRNHRIPGDLKSHQGHLEHPELGRLGLRGRVRRCRSRAKRPTRKSWSPRPATLAATIRARSSSTSRSGWRAVARSAVYRVDPLSNCAGQRLDRGGSQIESRAILDAGCTPRFR